MSELRPLRVLVACEESQVVCKAFRARGHEAYSCDLQYCSGGHPEWHIMHDAVEVARLGIWDVVICFPPCTYLCSAGQACKTRDNKWNEREAETAKAIEFVLSLYNCGATKIAIENPVGVLSSRFRKPNQIIEPYYFGDHEKKPTCLWLRGLSRLNATTPFAPKPEPTHIYPSGRKEYFGQRVGNAYRFSKDRGKMKSKTFPGIAKAMAAAWSEDLGNTWNL